MQKKYCNYFNILLLITTTLIIILLIHNNNLKEEITTLNTELNNKNIIITQLNKDITKLNNSVHELKKEKQNLNFTYSNLKENTTHILQDVNNYQKEIQESINWYKLNAQLNNSTEQKRIKRHIDLNCVKIIGNTCKIKLGCFYLLNIEKFDLNYEYDQTTYNTTDKLSSIEEFLKNEGGDCEDYSLFYKAEYNYVLNQCEDKNIILEGWKIPNSSDKKIKYWLNFQKTWYLDDVVNIDITEHIFPNIVCGNLYDPISQNISGHCMIAFTKNKINSLNDLTELNGAYLIEPQDGSFKGNINEANSEVYLLNEKVWFNESVKSWIHSVITDEDYYLFSETSLKWESYNSFYLKLEEQKKHFLK